VSDSHLARIEALETRGEALRGLLQFASRAFVMEFAGTPKSGKSTTVEAIRHFFSRHGFRVHVLAERAALCPIPMKGHLFFNTWCAASMLAELLANVETETDIIIVDRGIFDALVWLTLQERRGELTAEEARTFEAFLLMERWRGLTDLAVVMSVSPEAALARESSQRLTRKTGSIMNPEVLQAITDSVDEAATRYAPKFHNIVRQDTTGKQFSESGIDLANNVLDCLNRFLNPQILVVPKKEIELLASGPGRFGEKAVRAALDCISLYGHFMLRADAEAQPEYVQIIPCGLITYKKELFLFQRKGSDPKYRLFGKTTLWQGTHVSKREGDSIPELLKNALMERISRTLFLSRIFPVEPIGYCWDQNDADSSRHFGMIYRIQIDNPATAIDLRKKEFRRQRGHALSGQFHNWETLKRDLQNLNLETWSKAILQDLEEVP
jgi:predicted NUDIX family phosphoesterase